MRTSTLTWASALLAISGLAIARGLGADIDVRTAIIALLFALAAALALGALIPAAPSPTRETGGTEDDAAVDLSAATFPAPPDSGRRT